MWSAITSIVSGLVSPITTAYTRKQELNAAQHAADLAAVSAQGERQADLIKQGKADDAAWEMESLKAGAGFARYFELIVVSIPMVMCFTRWAHVVRDGFAALSGTPLWYQSMLIMIYGANYGIRMWRRNQSDT